MRILGIETSCDETAAAIVKDGTVVEHSIIASTKDVFAQSGGVVPEDAARRQLECILPVLHTMPAADVDALAVTRGPGLLGSLLVGTVTARLLASLWKKPLIGVHHTFGHLSSAWLSSDTPPVFPVLTLSVSGGHTDLWYRTSHTTGKLVGRTRDDAAGEAFDKGARMLGLPYPGGPSIAKAAETGQESAHAFPIALCREDTLDFSFSGIKTALRTICTEESLSVADLAASYQFGICRQLTERITDALEQYPDVQEVHIVGGVSANTRLRSMASEAISPRILRTPPKISFCTDNAAMIAGGAYFLHAALGEAATAPFTTEAVLPLTEVLTER